MSLSKSKRICLRSDTRKRQSFEERFCDDLVTDILQYLPLKDKLRLEEVSKQFQRNIFQRQHYLWINRYNTSFKINTSDDYFFKSKYEFNFKAFESVLKKCPNIKSIVLKDVMFWKTYLSHKIIGLIEKNCNNLIEFNTEFVVFKCLWNEIIKKMDSKGFTLRLDRIPEYDINCETLALKTRLNINCNNCYPLFISDLFRFKQITSLNICISDVNQINDFKTLVENNKSIKYLNFVAYNWNSILDSQQVNRVLNIISKLKDLIELKIISLVGLNDSYIDNESPLSSLKSVANNCLKLKSISCYLDPLSSKDPLSSLKILKQLKRLEIQSFYLLNPIPVNFELFKGFDGLTHLTLKDVSNGINSNGFKGMDGLLPKLRVLKIRSIININEESIDILCRLSDLEVIDIIVKDETIKQNIESKLLKKCRKIRKIDIKF